MKKEYEGFELGPIRPPSEAQSLMLRVTRNCPWNKCTFCSLYKDERFSIRPKEHIFKDIDLIKKNMDVIESASKTDNTLDLGQYYNQLDESQRWAYFSAKNWFENDKESIFLQDANTMVIKPKDMIEILDYVKKVFPHKKRITSYARSQTITKISDEMLKKIYEAGLNRIHIGMESANDTVLQLVKKGATKQIHIEGGLKVKKAGIELSEYYMPGLGGREYSAQNAYDTADALNQIEPEFIRIRTLALKDNLELFEDYEKGVFSRIHDVQVIEELLSFVEQLREMNSVIKSDHILNLLPEVEGYLKKDKTHIVHVLESFLKLTKEEQNIYKVGRRLMYMESTKDLKDLSRRKAVENVMLEENITFENIDMFIENRMNQFI